MAEVGSPGGVTPEQMQAALSAAVAPLAAKADMPTPATSAPPSVADTSAKGDATAAFALADHTHASKARKARLTTATDGTVTWTFSPPFAAGVVPRVVAVAETAVGVTDVINVQIEGTPTNTSCKLRANRTTRSVAAVLGLTILSVPGSVGATLVHALALEP